jgi:hypothetical protein
VPNLTAEDGWLEAPFWVWRKDDPRRRAVFARASGKEVHLADRAGFELRLPLSTDAGGAAAAAILHALPARGVKLRTRALTTTLWARLALGDLFIHGLGGAKYDQLTDALIQRFFGLEPAAFLTVSGTLYLPVPRPTVGEQDLRRLDRQLRDLHFGPERFLDASQAPPADRQALGELIAAKHDWIGRGPAAEPGQPDAYPTPRDRFLELRRLSEALRPWVQEQRQRVLAQRQTIEHQLRADRVLGSREYAFCFYPWEKMRILLLEFPPGSS